MARLPRIPSWRSKWLGLRISTQLFLAMSLATFILLSGYFLFDLVASVRRVERLERASVESLFPVLERIVVQSMLTGEHFHLRNLLAIRGANRLADSVLLLDQAGRAVNTDDIAANRRPARRFDPPTRSIGQTFIDFPLRSRPDCARCHGTASGPLGYLRVSSRRDRKARILFSHIKAHFAILASLTLCMGLASYLIAEKLIRAPLNELIEAMRRLASGKLGTRLDTIPGAEFKALGQGFNAMSERLKDDRREIMSLHRGQVAHMERLVSLGELSAQLAHEVRNPLTGIGSAIQVVRQDFPAGSPKRDALDKVLHALERINRSMENFLRFSRIPETVRRPFALRESVERVAMLIAPRLRSQDVRWTLSLPDDLPLAAGDPAQIEQVLLNLCINALPAMPSGGDLRLSLRPGEKGSLVIEISDTGRGIPPQDLERVFQPFFSTREKGSGLGLSISKQIVKAHGGGISISSELGRGTTVTVTLAVADESASS